MFEVLKPIIEGNKQLDDAIGELCKDLTKEINEIEQIPVNQYIQDRLDKIRNLIDCLESNYEFNLDSEIDDLKLSFDSLLTTKIERDHYYPTGCTKFEEKLTEFCKWIPTKD